MISIALILNDDEGYLIVEVETAATAADSRAKGSTRIPSGSHAQFPLAHFFFFVGVGGAPARVLGEEHDGKVARLVRVPPHPPIVDVQALL